jgi:hypothetical protein
MRPAARAASKASGASRERAARRTSSVQQQPLDQLGAGRHQVLAVVQDQQQRLVGDQPSQPLGHRRPGAAA